jgi:putative holliday junction resolvase
VLGIDIGRKRIGLAVSDASRTLARPLGTLTVQGGDPVERVLGELVRLEAEDDGIGGIVVGVPVSLEGLPGELTSYVTGFIQRLKARTSIPVFGQDERLTSREAESRLALRERDWRKRKARIDAAAAAIILQDYLDSRGGRGDGSTLCGA